MLSCLGGLGHTLMDFTNTYGVRPFLPFSRQWFYGDLVFIVDPWIWLILGSGAVWLTTTDAARSFVWVILGIIASLIVALALRAPAEQLAVIRGTARVIWFWDLVDTNRAWLERHQAEAVRYSLFVLGCITLYLEGAPIGSEAGSDVGARFDITGCLADAVKPCCGVRCNTEIRLHHRRHLFTKQSECTLEQLSKFIEPLRIRRSPRLPRFIAMERRS